MIVYDSKDIEEPYEIPEEVQHLAQSVAQGVSNAIDQATETASQLARLPDVLERLGERVQAPININPIGIKVEVAEQAELARAICGMVQVASAIETKVTALTEQVIALQQPKPEKPKEYVLDVERDRNNFISRVHAKQILK